MSSRRAAGIKTGIDRFLAPRASRCLQTIGPMSAAALALLGGCTPSTGSGAVALDASVDGGVSLASCLAGAVTSAAPPACSQFVTCLESSCQADLTAAFGSDYGSGTITGACAGFEMCATSSQCTTEAGVTCAGNSSSACQQDIQALVACGTSPDAGTGTQSCLALFDTCETGLLNGLYNTGGSMADAGMDAALDGSQNTSPDTGITGVPPNDASTNAGDGSTDGSIASTIGAIAVDSVGNVFVGPDPTSSSSDIYVFGPGPSHALLQVLTPAQVDNADAGTPLVSPNGPYALAIDGPGHLLVGNDYESLGSSGCYFTPPTAYGSDVTSYVDQGSSASPLGPGSVLIGNPLSTQLSCVTGVSVSSGGDIFVATATGVEVFDGSGTSVASAAYPMSANPGGIAADPTSSFAYVADSNNGAVYQYQLTGTALTLTRTISVNGGASSPETVAVDANGSIYVADWASGGTIDIYSSTGALTGKIPVACAAWLGFDSAGNLYVSCRYQDIQVYAKQAGDGGPDAGPVWTMTGHFD